MTTTSAWTLRETTSFNVSTDNCEGVITVKAGSPVVTHFWGKSKVSCSVPGSSFLNQDIRFQVERSNLVNATPVNYIEDLYDN